MTAAVAALLVSVRRHLAACLPPNSDWLDGWPGEATRIVTPAARPVLRYLVTSPELRQLEWRQTYSEAEVGAEFLLNYAWAELIGTRGPFASTTMLAGFILLGPETLYRRHRHAAEELYLPLSGTADWWREDSGWVARPPGAPIHHPSSVVHATRTGAEPLLALYLWRGEGLSDKSELL